MKNLVILSGAGMSAESGIKTFRDTDGLWENYNINEVATPGAFAKNPELVLRFYNARRKGIEDVQPNQAHKDLVKLEEKYNVTVITQNIDDLHERAGSSNIYHLHGEITKMRSSVDESLIYPYNKDILIGDLCEKGSQLRPHIVWFGEAVPMIPVVEPILYNADIVVIIGTSMQVYPAAGLVELASDEAEIYYIDPNPAIIYSMRNRKNFHVIADSATNGVDKLLKILL